MEEASADQTKKAYCDEEKAKTKARIIWRAVCSCHRVPTCTTLCRCSPSLHQSAWLTSLLPSWPKRQEKVDDLTSTKDKLSAKAPRKLSSQKSVRSSG